MKLLRVLNDGEVLPIGATEPVKVKVRIIAATNRTLTKEVAAGRFRADLFYRLAVALLRLPPLRERQGDFMPLVDYLLRQINAEFATDPDWQQRSLAPEAMGRLQGHRWPGNVRELSNTLTRAALWSNGTTITAQDLDDALLEIPHAPEGGGGLLDAPVAQGVNLPELMGRVARHYLTEAMAHTGGNKTRAADLLGLPSYMTLSNWLKKYQVDHASH